MREDFGVLEIVHQVSMELEQIESAMVCHRLGIWTKKVSRPYLQKGLVPEHKRDQEAVLGRPPFYAAYWPFLTAVPLLQPAPPTLFRPCRLIRVKLDKPVGPKASCGLIVGSQ